MTLLQPGQQIIIDGVTVEVDAKVRLKVDGPPAHIVFPNGREMRPPIADLSAAELLERAAEIRRMSATATTPDVRDALERLAARYERVAASRGPHDLV